MSASESSRPRQVKVHERCCCSRKKERRPPHKRNCTAAVEKDPKAQSPRRRRPESEMLCKRRNGEGYPGSSERHTVEEEEVAADVVPFAGFVVVDVTIGRY